MTRSDEQDALLAVPLNPPGNRTQGTVERGEGVGLRVGPDRQPLQRRHTDWVEPNTLGNVNGKPKR
jgi:hypothetical protein